MGEISKFNSEKLTRQRPTRRARQHGGRWRTSTFERYRKPRLPSGCPVPQLIADLERVGGVQSLRLPDGLVDRFSPIKKLGPDLTSGSIKAKNNAVFSTVAYFKGLKDGGRWRTRTADPLRVKQVL